MSAHRKPWKRSQNTAATREFTRRLSRCAELMGAQLIRPQGKNGKLAAAVFESGNAGEDDDAFIFECELDGLLFNVEVFGPYWEEES